MTDTTTTPGSFQLDPDGRIALADIPTLLATFFDLDEPIDVTHVYVWWNRSQNNRDIRVPMPTPIERRGERYLWTQQSVVHWYASWKGLAVPWCRAAGDRTDSRGRDIPSTWRRVYPSELPNG